ncbi:hypothetical protein UPYG_G00165980 [Umbra pygmaea]|uniref:Uncharacterized protein n=1 Tax=Umbra pygmaea TaxID=75934 RepID=A0ABD0X8M4_UMBPY
MVRLFISVVAMLLIYSYKGPTDAASGSADLSAYHHTPEPALRSTEEGGDPTVQKTGLNTGEGGGTPALTAPHKPKPSISMTPAHKKVQTSSEKGKVSPMGTMAQPNKIHIHKYSISSVMLFVALGVVTIIFTALIFSVVMLALKYKRVNPTNFNQGTHKFQVGFSRNKPKEPVVNKTSSTYSEGLSNISIFSLKVKSCDQNQVYINVSNKGALRSNNDNIPQVQAGSGSGHLLCSEDDYENVGEKWRQDKKNKVEVNTEEVSTRIFKPAEGPQRHEASRGCPDTQDTNDMEDGDDSEDDITLNYTTVMFKSSDPKD